MTLSSNCINMIYIYNMADIINLRYYLQSNHYKAYFWDLLLTVSTRDALFEIVLAFSDSKNIKFTCCLKGFVFELP